MDAVPQSGGSDASRPSAASPADGESVLDAVERESGASARILLRGSEREETPTLEPQGDASGMLPRGRGSYRVLGEIARGGMGVILKAHDRDLGRDVALKVLDERLVEKPGALQRFVEEAQIGGQLQHPGVVPVYELGLMADARPYFTMKLVKGRTLESLLTRRKSLDEERLRYLSIFESVCQTLAYAHSKGVIHRDLKPANVMVGAFGEVQVVDWGLSKVLRKGSAAGEQPARKSDFTVIETVRSGPGTPGAGSLAGSILGTPAYMPPEQARGEIDALDERADVFALGAILCEILSGKPPYVDTLDATALQMAARGHLAPARERLASSGAELELVELCLSCLAAAPAVRPVNAEELARAVHGYLSATEERARRAQIAAAEAAAKAQQERKARRLTVTLAVTVVVALVLGGLGWIQLQRQERERVDLVREQVDAARSRAERLQDASRHAEAQEAVAGLHGLVETFPPEHPLRALVQRSVAQVEERASRARESAGQAARDQKLLARLDELGAQQVQATTTNALSALEPGFGQAFREWGLELESDLELSAERLRASGLQEEVALALDDWARLRRALHGPKTPLAEGLTSLAADLDPDPRRLELRDALLAGDRVSLSALAESTQVQALPPSTLWMLSMALIDLEDGPPASRLLERAVRWYPNDYRLRVASGIACEFRERSDLALEHYATALGLRPENRFMRLIVARNLLECGLLPAAMRAARAALEDDPQPDEATLESAHRTLADCCYFLGDFKAAAEHFQARLDLNASDLEAWAMLQSSLFSAGELPVERLREAFESNPRSSLATRFILALSLADPSPGVSGDPELALSILEPQSALGDFRTDFARTFCFLSLGRTQDALRLLRELHGRSGWLRRDIAGYLAAATARAHALAGDVQAAGIWLEAARNQFALLAEGEPQAWERSIFATQLRAAEAALEGR